MLVQLYKGGIDSAGFSDTAFMDNMREDVTSRPPVWPIRGSVYVLCSRGPNSGCKSRHGAPVFIIHRIALNVRRSSLRLRPLVSVPAFANIGPIIGPTFRRKCRVCSWKNKSSGPTKSREFCLETAPREASFSPVAQCPDRELRRYFPLERWNGWNVERQGSQCVPPCSRMPFGRAKPCIRMKPVSDKAATT